MHSSTTVSAVLTRRAPWHLEHGDCLSVLRQIPDGAVDAVVTDPPYGIGYRNTRGQTVANDGAPFVWDKGSHGMGDTAAQFGPQHEVMWFATKGKFKFPGRRPVSVLRAARVPHGQVVHPTEKPVPLMAELLSVVVPAGGLVLDPFSGSGSTGAAARARGFRFLGVELDAGHAATARVLEAAEQLGAELVATSAGLARAECSVELPTLAG